MSPFQQPYPAIKSGFRMDARTWLDRLQLYYDNLNSDGDFSRAFDGLDDREVDRRLRDFARDWYLPTDRGVVDLAHSLQRRCRREEAWPTSLLADEGLEERMTPDARTEALRPAIDLLLPNGRPLRRLLVARDDMPTDSRSLTARRSADEAGRPWRIRAAVWGAWRLYRATRGDNAGRIAASENALKRERRLPQRLEDWMQERAKDALLRRLEAKRRRDLAMDVPDPRSMTFHEFLVIPPVHLGEWDRGKRRKYALDQLIGEAVDEQRSRLPVGGWRPVTTDAVQDSIHAWYRSLHVPKPRPRRLRR